MSSFFFDVLTKGDTKVYLLEINDKFCSEDFLYLLNQEELLKYSTFISNKRKNEFVAVRILKDKFFNGSTIVYNELGAPSLLDSNKFISISHAKNLIGLAYNEKFSLGFDIELIQDKVSKLHHKFMNDFEYNEFDCNSVDELISVWSMKECLYKLSGLDSLDFKSNFYLKKIDSNNVIGKIIHLNETKEVNLHYFKFKSYYISFNISQLK